MPCTQVFRDNDFGILTTLTEVVTMHETLKKRIFPLFLLAALVALLSVTGGCLKQSEVKWVEGQFPPPAITIVEKQIPIPAPPPAPKPMPVPVPTPSAQYTPKPMPKPTPIVLEVPGTMVDRRSYLIPTREETDYEVFGLCAYTVLPHVYPSQNTGIFSRYVKLHRAFKNVPQFNTMEARGTDKVNVLYWNLKREAFSANAYNIFDLPDNFYVENYDYSRAQAILEKIQGLDKFSGPFIVATRYQLGTLNRYDVPEDQEMLIVDLSRVHEDAFGGVVGSFFNRVLKNANTWKGQFEVDRIQAATSGPDNGQKTSVYIAKWNGKSFSIQK
ncbi:MAG: hypothetical protein JEZ02_04360 [Desulfatibacillum sp.]|nr:hypothetical protein [Desulfatibacillum sp.]